MIVIAVYYGLSWFFTSRTARIRAVSEKIEVPCDEEGHPYSPAALRFLWRHEFDNRCFAASLMNMASGNLMRMGSPEKHVLHFHKESGDPVPPLGLEEFLACEAFFLDEKEQATNFQVAGKEQLLRAKIIIQGAVESLNLLGRFFAEKRGCFDTGTILCFCLFILVPLVEVLFVPESFRLLVFSPFLFVGVLALTNAADRHFREWKSKTNDDKFGFVFILTLFYALVITIFVCDAILTTWWAIPLILEIVFFICFFQRRLTYSTPEGIEMQKRIESFRLFLQNNINSDSLTIVRLRPYAFALNLAEEPGFLRDVNWILSED